MALALVKHLRRLRGLRFSVIASVACAVIGPEPSATVAETVDGLVVTLVDEATIVSVVEGPIAQVLVEEGQTVTTKELVAKLDDRKMALNEQLAERELSIAKMQLEDFYGIQAAQSVADIQKLKISEQTIRLEIDRQRAANQLKVSAAQKAEAVAENEWERARVARENFTDSVSESEIEALRLAFERSELHTREAKFQNQIAELEVRLGEMTGKIGRSQLNAAETQVKEAASSHEVLAVEAAIKRLRLQIAEVEKEERHIRSPIDGQIVSVSVRTGDWVRPGDVIARVINTNRLRVQGFAPAAMVKRIANTQAITISITLSANEVVEVKGERQFVNPEIDPITNEIRFWIEFSNPVGRIHPGCRAKIVTGSD